MIRSIKNEDIPFINNLIADNDYIVNEYELKKSSSVYVDNNEIVAFISYQILYERAELNYIFVKESERRKGIASMLIEQMISDCRNKDVETIDLEVNSINESAIKLYQKFGFKVASKREKYYHGIDGLIMILEVKK